MSKTFKEDYYGDDGWGKKVIGKSIRKTRHKVKDYLRQIEADDIDEDFDIDEEIIED